MKKVALLLIPLFVAGCIGQSGQAMQFTFESNVRPTIQFTANVTLPLDKEEAFMVFDAGYRAALGDFNIENEVQREWVEEKNGVWQLNEGGSPDGLCGARIEGTKVIRICV
jgi:hypothetical protein